MKIGRTTPKYSLVVCIVAGPGGVRDVDELWTIRYQRSPVNLQRLAATFAAAAASGILVGALLGSVWVGLRR